jgi:hypothetical protein
MILHNLERARLLDILLWSGDIVGCSQNAGSQQPTAGDKRKYEGPQFRRLSAGGVLPN